MAGALPLEAGFVDVLVDERFVGQAVAPSIRLGMPPPKRFASLSALLPQLAPQKSALAPERAAPAFLKPPSSAGNVLDAVQ
ncbi:MAG TPA: hypothetical protein PKN13_12230 [Accumulibacter sp.]|nr:hypothetical protein [Accumulibacter sp.]HMW16905.1 hypothetical protein [Accumulibacter sp.]HMX23611.1 hypothetical protein [Accumulibacter sp.]HMY06443.1 hypothetical protein [Accumulibacter sp.]HND79792.1 hypothetical protein [Accumulibacter sp.]